jgi:radical S-adenosyl methionine domain-containing protein 2
MRLVRRACQQGAAHRKGDFARFDISDEQFEAFCNGHRHLDCMIPESNKTMASSYILMDEYLRFLDKGEGREIASQSILEVGVKKALSQVFWDKESFIERDGIYDWTKGSGYGASEAVPDIEDMDKVFKTNN